MQLKQHIVIVNGYGNHTEFQDPNIDRFVVGYRRYLSRLANFLVSYRPDLTIFSGSVTQKSSAPGKTEARVMLDFVKAKLSIIDKAWLCNPEFVVLEDRSYTTYFNSYYSAQRIVAAIQSGRLRNEPCLVTHFCEALRGPTVNMLDRHFLLDTHHIVEDVDDLRLETESWERAEPFKQILWSGKYPGSFVSNWLAIKYPWLGLAEREQRRKIYKSESA